MKFLKTEGRKIAYITIGSFIGSIGIVWFLNPVGLYSGGISGISQLIVNIALKFFDFKLNLGMILFMLNVPILIFGFIKISRKFIYYSIYSVILQSIFLGLLPVNLIIEGDILANALVGAILLGVGNGMSLRVGGSSGGTDILFQYISFRTHITMGTLGMGLNIVIISIAGFLFEWPIAIYTIIRVILTNLVVDKVHTSYNYIKLEVITEKGIAVAKLLVEKTQHGVTVTTGTGAFSNNDKTILNTIISAYELNRVVSIIRDIDDEAFINVSTVKKVVGNFTKIIID
ncbi:hypothetical protein CI105_00490 [Candidatus Izimaplasma bacterium ZiA1]|uniref:YitT family protein n=1 Tax=Candidatus Izimoplasma sp. ZiA1 TaxID=2024899 RepID=UPI000BAA58C1|nr:hypothetical protein CI105_00490 [Candidatus Izimaplasma bacterium ZiA1]